MSLIDEIARALRLKAMDNCPKCNAPRSGGAEWGIYKDVWDCRSSQIVDGEYKQSINCLRICKLLADAERLQLIKTAAEAVVRQTRADAAYALHDRLIVAIDAAEVTEKDLDKWE